MGKIDEVLKHLAEQDKVLARLEERAKADAENRATVEKRLDSHAGKIRTLEHWRTGTSGGLAVIYAWFGLK